MNRYFVIMVEVIITLGVGCSKRQETSEDKIYSHPVAWSGFKPIGASSNNWALLTRVNSVDDINEKVRLVKMLYRHMRSDPEEILKHDRHGMFYVFRDKMNFCGPVRHA